MSIKHTLTGLFAILAVVTALQGLINVVELVNIQSAFVSVADDRLPLVGAIREIERAVERVREKQFRLILSEPDPQVVGNNLIELQEAEADLAAARLEYGVRAASATDKVLYQGFSDAWDKYEGLTRPIAELMKRLRVADAQAVLMLPWLRVVFKNVEAKLAEAVEANTSRARNEAAASLASVKAAQVTTLAIVAVAALLAAGASTLTYLTVLRPLGRVTELMRLLAAGSVETVVPETSRRDEIGAMFAALGVFRDSLLRAREAEAARRKTQVVLENITSTVPDGIIGWSEDGVVSFWNRGAERLLGFRAGEIVGRSKEFILPSHSRLDSEEAVRRRHELVGRTVEMDLLHKDGSICPVEISYGRWTVDGRTEFCATVRDIRARKAGEAALFRLAHHDVLTDLPNRTVLTRQVTEMIDAGRPLALLLVDLDRFRQVNEAFGHHIGDTVIRIAASRLAACVGADDMVSRLGGDEFVLLLAGHADPRRAAAVAQLAIGRLSEPFLVEEQAIALGASVGIALAPVHARTADELLSCADMALYAAKDDGRHCHRLFTPDLRQSALSETNCRQELRRAVDNGEFVLFYQPQIRLSDGRLVGAEALIRWRHPERGLLAPVHFIDVLESSQYAAEVGHWVVRTACRQAAEWRASWAPDFKVGVNLSGALFRTGDLAERVERVLDECRLPAEALEVEITETIILDHDEALIAPLRRLRQAGVGVAFDDYGTGYASLSLLKRFPITRLKIDRSFVRDMESSPPDAAIVDAVLELGRNLGLHVTAEGIERESQLLHLKVRACAEGQGYFFGAPLDSECFGELLRAFSSAPHGLHTAAA